MCFLFLTLLHLLLLLLLLFLIKQRLKPGDDEVDGPHAIEDVSIDKDQIVTKYADEDDSRTERVLAPRADGLVREMKTKKVISREEIQERTETEDVKHFGDFTDEVRLKIYS